MPKDNVLPVVGYERALSFDELIYEAAVAQRDADLVILERDYVPKAQAKMLVEALEAIASDMAALTLSCTTGLRGCQTLAQGALARLGVEVKE